jgi:hypothetical protein
MSDLGQHCGARLAFNVEYDDIEYSREVPLDISAPRKIERSERVAYSLAFQESAIPVGSEKCYLDRNMEEYKVRKASLTRIRLDYTDMFGNPYSTVYEGTHYQWIPPASLL